MGSKAHFRRDHRNTYKLATKILEPSCCVVRSLSSHVNIYGWTNHLRVQILEVVMQQIGGYATIFLQYFQEDDNRRE
jgi:hypothetical protein